MSSQTGARATFWCRPLAPGDADFVHELHGNPTTNLNNPSGASPSLTASDKLLDGWLTDWDEHGFGYELVFSGDQLAGICGARRARWMGFPVLNLYWRLLPQYWGFGYAGWLGRHTLDAARQATPLPGELIVARMLPENLASAHLAENLRLARRHDLDGDLDGGHWIVYATESEPPAGP